MNSEAKKKNSPFEKLIDILAESRFSAFVVSIISIVLGLIVVCVILLLIGTNPLEVLRGFLQGCGFMPKANYSQGSGMISDIFLYLGVLAPMILAAVSFVVGMRASLFNIGISGQMLMAGFVGTVMIGYSDLGSVVAKPLACLIGLLVGALMGALVGFLKYKFNIHEVVSTILFNYIVRYVVTFFINVKYANIMTRSMETTSDASRLSITGVDFMGYKITIPIGIIIAICAVIIVKVYLDRTVSGFELRSVGLNRDCARYAGINVNKNIIKSMAISGALAGLAGILYYMGYLNTIKPDTLSDMGYDGIAVALLGNLSPVGCIFASMFITILQAGSTYMSSVANVSVEMSEVITGVILLFCACSGFITYLARREKSKLLGAESRQEKESAEDPGGGADDSPPSDDSSGEGAQK